MYNRLSQRFLITSILALPLAFAAMPGFAQNEPVPPSAPATKAPANGLPTLWLIGDSTVNTRDAERLGWGFPIKDLFDTKRINVQNRARGGRSSRTFLEEGLWDAVLTEMQPGDFVLMQFGHNDGGGLKEPRHRATLKGIGDETGSYEDPTTHQPHVVHTYGWYMDRYVRDAKAKGATPIVLSPIPRNIWKDGKVGRNNHNDYGFWSEEIARKEGVSFVDLNGIIADRYDAMGPEKVADLFPKTDHTHTTPAGAKLNAESVVSGIRKLTDISLKDYLLPEGKG